MDKKVLLLTLGVFMLISIPLVYGITIGKGVVFLSEIPGGNITFGWQFTADTITWNSNQVRFTGFNHTFEWANLGFRAPANGHLNVTIVNNTNIILDPEIHAPNIDYEVYVGGKGTPSSVTGADTWFFLVDTVYLDVNANNTVILTWVGPDYTIDVASIYSETEAGLYTMLYANCTTGGVSDDANVTFTVDGCAFTWNPTSSQYEGIIMKATPQTVVFDTVDAIASSEYVGETGTVNRTATVTWTTGTFEIWQQQLVNGNWVGGVMEILFSDITLIGGWSLIMAIFSIGIYQYSGPYAVFAIWILGWGGFSTMVHGTALSIGIIMMVLGLGIALAKLFLDRRTT